MTAGIVCIAKHGAILAALLIAAAGHTQDFSILYHERLGPWRLDAATGAKSSALQSQKPTGHSLLTFTAFGREFRVRLERNELLLRRLPSEAASALRGIDVLSGELVDLPGSWARLTRHGGELTGVIWDGAELFAIDSPAQLAPYLQSSGSGASSGPVIYRWRDTVGTLSDDVAVLLDAGSGKVVPRDAAAMEAGVLEPGRQLDLGVVADVEFNSREGANVVAGIVSRANIVDGIFIFQLGVHVNVAEIAILSQPPELLASLDAQQLLDQLESYRASTPAQRAQDLTHLLTGKEIVNGGAHSPQVAGIANFGGVCDERLGTSLTQATFGIATDALIIAHELGHNFGAPHDGEPGACENESPAGSLMARTLNQSQQFSGCSLQQMQPLLAAPCLDVLAPGDVEIRIVNPPADALIGEEFQVEVVVDNPSAGDAHRVEVTAEGTNLWVLRLASSGPQGLACSGVCRQVLLPSGGSAALQVVAVAPAFAPATLQVTVRAINDGNTANNVASHTFAARPLVDLLADFAPVGSEILKLGDEFDYRATVRNVGTVTITNASAEVWPWRRTLNVVTASSDVGACMPGSSGTYSCPLGDLAPGDERSLVFGLRAVDTLPPQALPPYLEETLSIAVSADRVFNGPSPRTDQQHFFIAESVADLHTTVSSPRVFQLNAPAELVVTVANLGRDPANDTWFAYNFASAQQALAGAVVTSNVGTCTILDRLNLRFDCHVTSLPPGESLVVTIRATASALGEFAVLSSTSFRGLDSNNSGGDSAVVYAVISPPSPPSPPAPDNGASGGSAPSNSSGGGGGGVIDTFWLALLTFAFAWRLVVPHGAQYSRRSSARQAIQDRAGRALRNAAMAAVWLGSFMHSSSTSIGSSGKSSLRAMASYRFSPATSRSAKKRSEPRS